MNHEFEVHHLVSQLVVLLKAQDRANVDSSVELLLKNRNPYVTAQLQESAYASKRKLAEFSSQGEQFLSKYEELKIKQSRDLNPLVYLLSKVADDAELCGFLQGTRPPPVAKGDQRRELGGDGVKMLDLVEGAEIDLPEKGAVLTEKELDELRGRLETVASTMAEKGKPKVPSPPSHYPPIPAWTHERPFLTRDFVTMVTPKGGVALGSLPVAMQQHAILDDLLSVLVGMDGRYIHPETLSGVTPRGFSVDPALDPSLHTLVCRTLPLASYYSIVAGFIEERSKFIHGMVNQGLCSAVRGLLKEYLVVIAQLESQQSSNQLTLQKLWYYLQPCMKTLDILSRVCVAVTSGACRGGKTLTTLHNLTVGYIGDQRSQEICLHVTQAASLPYLSMLGEWVYQGVVNDPYSEFMIIQHESFKKGRLHDEYNDAYWERRYTVAQDNIPSFLEHLAERILQTGKYLNVVRECGLEVACPGAKAILYSVHERTYVEQIETAYTYASQELLHLMIRDHDLLGHLHSMKHCFLLDQGDLIVHFMDMAEGELSKPMADILPQRLESLLELAVRTSLLDNDPYKDKLLPLLVPFDLVTQLLYILAIQPEGVGTTGDETPPPIFRPDPSTRGLSGLEAFSLDYDVGWPLSLVISRKCLFKYQMLFRHLFSCKHVERQLGASWSRHKQAKAQPLLARPWYASSYALLQRMLHFVQNLLYYMTFEVLEPNWVLLESNLRSVHTIDDVLTAHNDFLDRSLRDCLLSDKEVLKIISRLLVVCERFTDHLREVDMTQEQHKGKMSLTQLELTKRRTKSLSGVARLPSGEVFEGGADPHKLRSRLLSSDLDDLPMGSFEVNISRLDNAFTQDLVRLLDKLYEFRGQTVGGMVSRLDFNGFYQGRMTSRDITHDIT